MTHDDLVRHADLGQRLLLEGLGVDGGVAREVQLHVDDGGGFGLHDREGLVKGGRLVDLVDQGLGDRVAVLVDQELQHFRGREVVLVEL